MTRVGTAYPIERTGGEITKQSVASSQLATAVWLWSNQWDPVSVHVLASAAAEISAVLRRAKQDAPVHSAILEGLVQEFDEGFENYLKESFNFMKHGAKDPKATLKFNPNESEWVIYHTCVDYLATFGVAPPEALFFLVYMTDEWPWLLRPQHVDPFRDLRDQARRQLNGGKASRQYVGRSLADLHRFADHLREVGLHEHPLLRP